VDQPRDTNGLSYNTYTVTPLLFRSV